MPGRLVAGNMVERTDTAKTPAGIISATGSSQLIAASNPARIALWISNNSANKWYVSLSGTAVNFNGITVQPNTTIQITGYTGPVAMQGTAADVGSFAEI